MTYAMELISTLIGFFGITGIVAGIIAITMFLISKMEIQTELVGYTLKPMAAILIMAIIIFPFLIFPSIAKNRHMGLGWDFVICICTVWAIILPIIGWFAIIRDWYLKYKSLKSSISLP